MTTKLYYIMGEKHQERVAESFIEAQQTDKVLASIQNKLAIARKTLDPKSYADLESTFEGTKKRYYQERWQTSQESKKKIQELKGAITLTAQKLSQFDEKEVSFGDVFSVLGHGRNQEKVNQIEAKMAQFIDWKERCGESWISGYSRAKGYHVVRVTEFEGNLKNAEVTDLKKIPSTLIANYFIHIRNKEKARQGFIEHITKTLKPNTLKFILSIWGDDKAESVGKETLSKSVNSEDIKYSLKRAFDFQQKLDSLNLKSLSPEQLMLFMKELLPISFEGRSALYKAMSKSPWKEMFKNENIDNILDALYSQVHERQTGQLRVKGVKIYQQLLQKESIAKIAKKLKIDLSQLIKTENDGTRRLFISEIKKHKLKLNSEESEFLKTASAESWLDSDRKAIQENPNIKRQIEKGLKTGSGISKNAEQLLQKKEKIRIIEDFAKEKRIDIKTTEGKKILGEIDNSLLSDYQSLTQSISKIENSFKNEDKKIGNIPSSESRKQEPKTEKAQQSKNESPLLSSQEGIDTKIPNTQLTFARYGDSYVFTTHNNEKITAKNLEEAKEYINIEKFLETSGFGFLPLKLGKILLDGVNHNLATEKIVAADKIDRREKLLLLKNVGLKLFSPHFEKIANLETMQFSDMKKLFTNPASFHSWFGKNAKNTSITSIENHLRREYYQENNTWNETKLKKQFGLTI